MENTIPQTVMDEYYAQIKKYRWRSFFTILLNNFIVTICIHAPAPMLTYIVKGTGWTLGQAGMMSSGIVFLAYGIIMLIGGRVQDFIGHKNTSLISAALLTIGSVFALFSGESYAMHLIGRAIVGAGCGLGELCTAPTTGAYFSGHNESFWQGVRLVIVMLGHGLGYYIILPLLGIVGSWQTVLGLIGVLTFISFVLLAAFYKNAPHNPAQPEETSAKTSFKESGLGRALRSGQTWIYVIGFTATLWMFNTYSTYLPTFLEYERGWNASGASMLTGLISWMGIIASIVGGWLMAKCGRNQIFGWPVFVACIIGIVLTCVPHNSILIALGVIICGFGNAFYNPVYATSLNQLPWSNKSYYTASISMIFGLGYLFTYFVPNIFEALYKDGNGMSIANIWLIFAIILVIGLIPQFFAIETGPKGNRNSRRLSEGKRYT